MNAFTRLLLEQNHTLSLYDTDHAKARNITEKLRCKSANSIKELAKTSDTLIICTPLENTPTVIQETIKQVNDTNIIEIASLKKKTIPALKQTPKHTPTVSIHPMFGPDTKDIQGKTRALEVKKSLEFKNSFEDSRRIRNCFLEFWASSNVNGDENE